MSQIRFDGSDLSPRGARTPRYAQRIPVVAAAVALLVAAVLAGCGGGGGGGGLSAEEYEQAVNTAGRRLSTVFGLVDENTPTLNALAIKVERSTRTLESVTENLDELEPPEDARQAHDRLVDALRVLSRDLDALAAAARSGSRERVDEARAALLEPARQILAAIKQLQEAGYDVNQGSG